MRELQGGHVPSSGVRVRHPVDVAGQEGVELHESGLLDSSTVGANSFGAYLEFTTEGTRLRVELIMFRRGNLVGVVYSYSLPGTQPSVSVQRAATMLDAKMSDIILER